MKPRRCPSVAKPPMTQAFESGRRFSTCGIRVRPHRSGLPMPIAGRSGLRKPNRVSDGNLSVGRKPNRVSDGDLRSLRRSSLPMPVAGRSLRPSRASLAPCCRRFAILAALGQQGRLPGTGRPSLAKRTGPTARSSVLLRAEAEWCPSCEGRQGREPTRVRENPSRSARGVLARASATRTASGPSSA